MVLNDGLQLQNFNVTPLTLIPYRHEVPYELIKYTRGHCKVN